jgi:hypothetical protein
MTMPRKRPQPVAVAQAVSSAIPMIVGLLVALHIVDLTPDQAAHINDAGTQAVAAILTAATGLLTLVATLRARGKVTPLEDPRDDQGVKLVAAQPL